MMFRRALVVSTAWLSLWSSTVVVGQQDHKAFICKVKEKKSGELKLNTIEINVTSVDDHLANGDLLGSCEENCFSICSNGDFCTVNVDASQDECACLATAAPVVVPAGEKCCAPSGNVIPQDACCPTGDNECCGLSITECINKVAPFGDDFIQDVVGTSIDSPMPIFGLDPEEISPVVGGIYIATAANGATFEFEVTQIIGTSEEINLFFTQIDTPEILVAEVQAFYPDTDLEDLNANELSLALQTTVEDATQILQDFQTYLPLSPEDLESEDTDRFRFIFLGQAPSPTGLREFVGYVNVYQSSVGSEEAELIVWADPCRSGFNTTVCDPVPINIRRHLAEEENNVERNMGTSMIAPISTGNRHRRLLLPRPICQGAFDAAKAIASATKCEDGKVFTEDSICEGFVVNRCVQSLDSYIKWYERALAAFEIKEAYDKAKDFKKASKICSRIPPIGPKGIAARIACYAAVWAAIETKYYIRSERFKQALKENLDSLIDIAIGALKLAADACWDCECPEGQCCPDCTGGETCCTALQKPDNGGGTCIGEDQCCPDCETGQQCCEGTCIPETDCCPACAGTDTCCQETGTCVSQDSCCPECSAGQKCCEGNCVSENQCCPACTGGKTCCEETGVCIGLDGCCNDCPGVNERCCEGRCVGGNECCPACGSGQKCCNGSCIPSDECCEPLTSRRYLRFEDVVSSRRQLQTDPCCEIPPDPCCGNDDPCCDSEDPCCGSSDPCCGNPDCGGPSGDPHMTTFDGLRYDCQGRGEFILTQAGNMQVQSRFRKQGRVSLTVGIAMSEGDNSTVVEVSIPTSGGGPVLVVNGAVIDPPSDGYEDANVITVSTTGSVNGPFRITYKTTSLSVYCNYYVSFFFGRYFNCRVGLPAVYRGQGTVGLLGSADDNALNDWMQPDGTLVSIPGSYTARRGSPALDYCSRYWCNRDPGASLFSYYDNDSFTDYNGCDEGLTVVEPPVDLTTASPELRALCGDDEACLIDGILAGLAEAQAQLDEQRAVAAAASAGQFTISPSGIPSNTNVNLLITVDLSNSGIAAGTIEKFNLYRVDTNTAVREMTPILELANGGGMVFSGTLAAFVSAGKSLSFQAVAIIGGSESPTTVLTKLNAVTAYSADSGIGGGDDSGCGVSCDDGDLCTINTCNAETNTCESEPVACGIGEECDSFTGLCQDLQNLVPCVAVIDEWNSRNYASEWATFRSRYPQRPFCLLVPNAGIQTLPTGFSADTVNNPDGIDRTIALTVNRDNGNAELASDWLNACQLGDLSPSSIQFVGLFVDTSGSMTLNTVRSSYDKFLIDLEAAGLTFAQVFNNQERWIDPFLTTLAP